MLKFAIKKRRLNFTEPWTSTEENLMDDFEEGDPLKRLIVEHDKKAEGTGREALEISDDSGDN